MAVKPRGNVTGHWTSRKAERSAGKASDPAYEPARTPLGKELRLIRRKIIQSGQPLLDWEDIEKLTAQLRGEQA